MPCEDTLYCFKRKNDAEKLASDIKENHGHLGYCTVSSEGNAYSITVEEKVVLKDVTYAKIMAYILRKFW